MPSEYLLHRLTHVNGEMTHREEIEERKAKTENNCINSRHSGIPLLRILVLLPVLLLTLMLPLKAPGWQAPPPCPRSPGLWALPLQKGEVGGEGTRVRGVCCVSRVVGVTSLPPWVGMLESRAP